MFKESASFAGRFLNQGNQPSNITVDPNTFRTIVGNQVVNPSSSFQIDPSLLGSLLTGGTASSGSGGTSPTPGGLSVNIQALLALIPVVNDGDVITSDSFNLLRSALIAIAGQLGVTPAGGQSGTVNLSPAFLVNEDGPAWRQADGVAQLPPITQTGGANGWLPAQLPDNVRIQSMTVIGNRSGTIPLPGKYAITLVRQLFSDPTQLVTLITIDWSKDTGSNTNSASVNVQGAGDANESFKVVNNSLYKYYIIAHVNNAPPNTVTDIQVIQLNYTQV